MVLGTRRLIYNGEIYNSPELRTYLERGGARFESQTDTEVLLHLYRQEGLGCLSSLNGMFAFALWDPEERRLLLARDRAGIKPLFYAELPGGGLLFGSEIKALLAARCVDDAIDLQAHHDYLALNYSPGPRTLLRGIKKLQAGHALLWTPEGLRIWRYWEPPLMEPKITPRWEEAAEQVLYELRSAVRRRMLSDVPLGMFLSGGIDSSAVLMAMSEISTQPIKAFTIRFEEASYDESNYAHQIAQRFGAEHYIETVHPDADTFLGPLTEAFDEPYADSSAIPLWYLCRHARQHVTVALGGDGGDEVFAGYRSHYAWRLAGLYRCLPKLLRERLIPALVAQLPVSHSKVSFDLKARAFVRSAALPPAEAHYSFKEFLSEAARAQLRRSPWRPAPSVRLFQEAFNRVGNGQSLDAVLYSDFKIYLPDDILTKVDRVSMSHSLEARVPFLDHQLVDRVARLPGSYKLRVLRTKAILKRALRSRLPHALIHRSKAGFNVPMARWLSEDLYALSRDMLSPSRIKRLGLWEPGPIQSMLEDHKTRRRDNSRSLWALLSFMLFNERFREGRAA